MGFLGGRGVGMRTFCKKKKLVLIVKFSNHSNLHFSPSRIMLNGNGVQIRWKSNCFENFV